MCDLLSPSVADSFPSILSHYGSRASHRIDNTMPMGLYISVPFCRTKCSYCNFASDVFSRAVFEHYVERVAADLNRASEIAEQTGGLFEKSVDSVFLGGGTPTILDIAQLERLFVTISQNFALER